MRPLISQGRIQTSHHRCNYDSLHVPISRLVLISLPPLSTWRIVAGGDRRTRVKMSNPFARLIKSPCRDAYSHEGLFTFERIALPRGTRTGHKRLSPPMAGLVAVLQVRNRDRKSVRPPPALGTEDLLPPSS